MKGIDFNSGMHYLRNMNNNKDITAILSRSKNELSPLFARYPEIEAVYLFGSTISGDAGSTSDVDIAIRFTHELAPELCFDLRLKLMGDLERYFARPTDIVVLNSASLKMIRQVLTHGFLLYALEPEKEHLYAVQKQKEYFDFKYYLNLWHIF